MNPPLELELLLDRVAAAPAEIPQPVLLSRSLFWRLAAFQHVDVDEEFAYAMFGSRRIRTTLDTPLSQVASS